MSYCARGHRVVDSTGECVSLRESSPGVFENVSGPCDVVAAVLHLEPGKDWAAVQAEAWLEAGRPVGRSMTNCPRDLWTPRQKCPECVAAFLRQVVIARSLPPGGRTDV